MLEAYTKKLKLQTKNFISRRKKKKYKELKTNKNLNYPHTLQVNNFPKNSLQIHKHTYISKHTPNLTKNINSQTPQKTITIHILSSIQTETQTQTNTYIQKSKRTNTQLNCHIFLHTNIGLHK